MTTDALLARHTDAWANATSGAFLDGVRDGSLPGTAFRHWLAQDYLFVLNLLRFQARLLAAAPRPAHGLLAAGLVALETELGWFEGHADRIGLTLNVQPHEVTERYRQAFDERSADWHAGLTALWTGERAYLEAWRAAAPGALAYREFVDHWTQREFGDYVAGLGSLVDAAGADESAFLAICALERDFWRMAWDSAPS